jgi:hypothetical protein
MRSAWLKNLFHRFTSRSDSYQSNEAENHLVKLAWLWAGSCESSFVGQADWKSLIKLYAIRLVRYFVRHSPGQLPQAFDSFGSWITRGNTVCKTAYYLQVCRYHSQNLADGKLHANLQYCKRCVWAGNYRLIRQCSGRFCSRQKRKQANSCAKIVT